MSTRLSPPIRDTLLASSSTERTISANRNDLHANGSEDHRLSPVWGDSKIDGAPDMDGLRSSALPEMSLPPPVVRAPESPILRHAGDDALTPNIYSHRRPSPPPSANALYAPLARPAALRRAVSDFDHKARFTPPGLHRSISITADLDKSPKRTPADAELRSPSGLESEADSDTSRARKSPRRSPFAFPALTPMEPSDESEDNDAYADVEKFDHPTIALPADPTDTIEQPSTPALWLSNVDTAMQDQVGDIGLVDEGDVLPSFDFQMDVTFDDEGLNTLERIFLLSKSEYPFHRAYVARVLGDLLNDVDPCESVEYVLPLLSGFSMDDDESVKEAFASELHRILWYFYSTCRLVHEDTEAMAGMEYDPKRETMTLTSDGLQVVPKPTAAEIQAAPEFAGLRRQSVSSIGDPGPSSASSSLTHPSSTSFSPALDEGDTPTSTISDAPSSQGTAFSPGAFVNPYADDSDPEKGWAKDTGPLVDRPTLAVGFFTPLLGSLLLNENPGISDSVRAGVVNIIGRLRHQGSKSIDIWGRGITRPEVDERRTFPSQNGPHAHDLRPFTSSSRTMVENELLQGIVIGMGSLATEMPEMLFADAQEDGHSELGGMYPGDHDEVDQAFTPSGEAEAFQSQLILEATAGRATSMNLIGAICEFYSGREAVDRGFLDEILRSDNGDVPVRAEGAVALSLMAKVAPVDQVHQMVRAWNEQ